MPLQPLQYNSSSPLTIVFNKPLSSLLCELYIKPLQYNSS